jgi:hypothetical protein
MHLRRLSLLLMMWTCGRTPHAPSLTLAPVQPLAARTTWDSVVAVVLQHAVVHGLPDFRPRRRVLIQGDSAFISLSSLPRMDSIEFVLLDRAQVQQAANELGDLNVLTVARFHLGGDTAKVSAVSHWVWQQRPGRLGMSSSVSACEYRLRRLDAAWQIDSTIGCVIS